MAKTQVKKLSALLLQEQAVQRSLSIETSRALEMARVDGQRERQQIEAELRAAWISADAVWRERDTAVANSVVLENEVAKAWRIADEATARSADALKQLSEAQKAMAQKDDAFHTDQGTATGHWSRGRDSGADREHREELAAAEAHATECQNQVRQLEHTVEAGGYTPDPCLTLKPDTEPCHI